MANDHEKKEAARPDETTNKPGEDGHRQDGQHKDEHQHASADHSGHTGHESDSERERNEHDSKERDK